MPRARWRTVSCTDDSLRSHNSQQAAYRWVGGQPAGCRFRLQIDEGFNWENFATVVSRGDGSTDEEGR